MKANIYIFCTICYICRWSSFDWPIHFFFTLGIFAAAHDLKTEWVVIKGISGYADCAASLTKQWLSFASVMAASVMYNILSDTFVFEQWPHYQNPINSSQRTRNEGTAYFKAMKNDVELAVSDWNSRLVLKWWHNKLEQGHPTTVFCKISVLKSKYYLEFSITWGWLEISRWLFHSCTIFKAYLINSLRFSEV